jgi:predicted nucleic acid-binding protein
MRRLLLLDADVVIDLHVIGLFGKVANAYALQVTEEVFEEAIYYRKGGRKVRIDIEGTVGVIRNVSLDSLRRVQMEAREARTIIDPGEATSIASLLERKEDLVFCTFDKAAIKLVAFMQLESRSISLETALRNAGIHRPLFPRHLDKTYKESIKEGKTLRIQFKNLT